MKNFILGFLTASVIFLIIFIILLLAASLPQTGIEYYPYGETQSNQSI